MSKPSTLPILWGAGLIALAIAFPLVASFFNGFESALARGLTRAFYFLFYFGSFLLAAFGIVIIAFGVGRLALQSLKKVRANTSGAKND
ncbi:hypothetical protein FZX02_02230 [Synechococcus sp. MU1644]|nr:hypothetical protein [Synechococcus sp. MU1644]